MMLRRNTYLSALKYRFQQMVLDGVPPRFAYARAKRLAAYYAFNLSSNCW